MKLKTPDFKEGMEVWCIEWGFSLVDRTEGVGTDEGVLMLKNGAWYNLDGKRDSDWAHRSLFTLEEAEQLFGVVKEKKKKTVKMYQALCFDDLDKGRLYVAVKIFESEELAKKYCGGLFVKLLTDRPIEVEIDE